jgi:hypothetical protein
MSTIQFWADTTTTNHATTSTITANTMSTIGLDAGRIVGGAVSTMQLWANTIDANRITASTMAVNTISTIRHTTIVSLTTSTIAGFPNIDFVNTVNMIGPLNVLQISTGSIVGIPTFASLPLCPVVPTTGNQLANKAYVDNVSIIGNLLRVDAVYGNDVAAALAPFQTSFKTISAALAAASAGQTVYVYPGSYDETIIIPVGVSVRGANSQTTIIELLTIVSNTPTVTMNQNTMLEDVTINSNDVGDFGGQIGIEFLTGASQNSIVRNCCINMPLAFTGTIGIKSSGASATDLSAWCAVQSVIINIPTGTTTGISIEGSNRLAVRNTVVFVGAAGIGCKVNSTGAVLDLDGCKISGVVYDIAQGLGGTVIISMTELVHRTTNVVLQTYITGLTNPAGGYVGMLWLNSGIVYSHI